MIGYAVPHKYPRRRPLGEIAWATWQKGRLVALVADEHGSFRTPALLFDGTTMRANCKDEARRHASCRRLSAMTVHPYPATPSTTATRSAATTSTTWITWRGDPTIRRHDNQPVSFRVKLSHGEIFGLTFG